MAGLILSFLAWYQQDSTLTGEAISLYAVVPAALLVTAIITPKIRSTSILLAHSGSMLGLVAFCYGMFLLLLYQHVA